MPIDDHLTKEIRDEGLGVFAERMLESFSDLAELARALESDMAKNAIERNFGFHSIVKASENLRSTALAQALETSSLHDRELSLDAKSVIGGILNKRAEFEALFDVAWGEMQSMLTQLSRGNDEVSQLRSALAAANARIKEHALHNAEVRETVWNMTGGKCFYCEVELIRCVGDEQDRSRCFHIDHIVPKASGGPDHISNYAPACERCNISKVAKSFFEFLAWRKAQQAQPLLTVIEGGAVA